MKKTLILCLLASCNEVVTEYSDTYTEIGSVSDVVFTPSRHETNVNFGMDWDGNPEITYDDEFIPERFAVVFRCPHGKFIIEKKSIYDAMLGHDGEPVTIYYREIYRSTYEEINGERKLISKILIKYDFLKALFR